MVEVYTQRVARSHFGQPIVPVKRFIDGHRSPNKWLAAAAPTTTPRTVCRPRGRM